jgi:pimeloyl-ACP methyl ester carboxylesterase
MLHGWGQSVNTLRPMGQLLSAYRKVHLIDLPGFGASPRPLKDWSTAEYAERIRQYMDDSKIEQADLLGHSFGGKICMRIANLYPTRVGRMVLIDSSGLKASLTLHKQVRGKAIAVLRKTIKILDQTMRTNLFEKWYVPSFGSRDYKNAGQMRNILVKTVNEDISTEASQILTPTLILWGEEDTETPPEMARRLHQFIRNSQLIFLPGKDHFPFLGEGAHLCVSYIRQFLLNNDTVNGSMAGDYASA